MDLEEDPLVRDPAHELPHVVGLVRLLRDERVEARGVAGGQTVDLVLAWLAEWFERDYVRNWFDSPDFRAAVLDLERIEIRIAAVDRTDHPSRSTKTLVKLPSVTWPSPSTKIAPSMAAAFGLDAAGADPGAHRDGGQGRHADARRTVPTRVCRSGGRNTG